MSDVRPQSCPPTRPDPLIDEVRALRRAVVAEFDNDVDRLCDHLREVAHEYRTRTGMFSDLGEMTAEDVTATWHQQAAAEA